MDEQIQEIAKRLCGLRDMLDISPADIAKVCHIPTEEYLGFESGEKDIPISVLQNISKEYNVEMTALLFGEEPKMKAYSLTRAGQGTAMERTRAYKYQALASGFVGRKADPFIVTVESKPETCPMYLNNHNGHEFNYVLEGSMLISIDGHEMILNEGDSIYFDSTRAHGLKALKGKSVKILAIIF